MMHAQEPAPCQPITPVVTYLETWERHASEELTAGQARLLALEARLDRLRAVTAALRSSAQLLPALVPIPRTINQSAPPAMVAP